MQAENILSADLLDDSDSVFATDNDTDEGNYDEIVAALKNPVDDKPPVEQTTPPASDGSAPPVDQSNGQPSGEQQAPPATSTDDWDEAPAPITDWQSLAQQQNIPARSEAEYRENAILRQYVQQEFNRDTESHPLYSLIQDSTPAKARLTRYEAERLREPYEAFNDPDLLSRVEGKMTDYFDDENELTPKGQKMDEFLKKKYSEDFGKKMSQWTSAAQTAISNEKLFVTALKESLAKETELTADEQKAAYRFIRKGDLARIVDGLDEQDKPLAPAEIAKRQASTAMWASEATRKILLEKRDKANYERGKSDALKQQLN